MIIKTAKPLTCRLNLHHRWRWPSNDDGDRYQQCEKCGKDRSEKVGGDPVWAPALASSSRAERKRL